MPLSHFVPAYPSPSPCPQVHSLRLRLYSNFLICTDMHSAQQKCIPLDSGLLLSSLAKFSFSKMCKRAEIQEDGGPHLQAHGIKCQLKIKIS